MTSKPLKALAAVLLILAVAALFWAWHTTTSAPYSPPPRDADYWRRRAAQPDDSVRAHAFKQLGGLRDTESIPLLSQAVQSDKNGFIRAAAAETLGDLRSPAQVPLLRTALEDSDRRVSDAATRALAQIASPDAQTALIAAIDEKEEHKTVVIVMELPAFKSEKTEDTLLRLLDSRSAWIRWRTIVALGKVGTTRAVPKLQQLLPAPLLGTNYDAGPYKEMDFLGTQIREMLTDSIDAASKRSPWPSHNPSVGVKP